MKDNPFEAALGSESYGIAVALGGGHQSLGEFDETAAVDNVQESACQNNQTAGDAV